MKLFAAGVLAVALIPSQNLRAQDASSQAMPDSVATLRYIHAAWDTLTRSMSDCKTLADTKVNSEPVLYLPADMPAPPEVAEVGRQCNVRIATLPRKIDKLGDVRPEELPEPGLLYLPHPYVVPGGRFNEMYGWDSYFIVLGLEADHRAALAKGIVDNFLFEIEHYGAVLNANRTYYLTRSQPPFLTSMVRAVFENPESFAQTPDGRLEARQWLQHAYELAQKDYATWIRPEHKAGATGLTRYYDYGSGPVPEMADDSTYYSDVIRWLVENPHAGGEGFLVKGSEHPNAAEMSALKQTSCDVETSVVCMKAWADGYRLSKEFYKGDRAMRESGFDTGFRFGPFDGNAENYAPVDLNSLLFRYERDLEHLALLLGQARDAEHWDRRCSATYGGRKTGCMPTSTSSMRSHRTTRTLRRCIRYGQAWRRANRRAAWLRSSTCSSGRADCPPATRAVGCNGTSRTAGRRPTGWWWTACSRWATARRPRASPATSRPRWTRALRTTGRSARNITW
jgi:alpha,alpha-trehalase